MIADLFQRRIRGFRVVEVTGLAVLLVLMLVVYLAKTFAGTERTEIARVERQISDERVRVRLLRAEVAHLEQPERIERLSRQYLGMQPVTAKREVNIETIPTLSAPSQQP